HHQMLETVRVGTADLQDRDVSTLDICQPRHVPLDHHRQQHPFSVSFHEHHCVGEEEVAVRQLQEPPQETTVPARLELRQVLDLGCGDTGQAPQTPEISDWTEGGVMDDVGRMCGDDELGVEPGLGLLRHMRAHRVEERLLELGVHVRLRLLDHHQMQRRTFYFF